MWLVLPLSMYSSTPKQFPSYGQSPILLLISNILLVQKKRNAIALEQQHSPVFVFPYHGHFSSVCHMHPAGAGGFSFFGFFLVSCTDGYKLQSEKSRLFTFLCCKCNRCDRSVRRLSICPSVAIFSGISNKDNLCSTFCHTKKQIYNGLLFIRRRRQKTSTPKWR